MSYRRIYLTSMSVGLGWAISVVEGVTAEAADADSPRHARACRGHPRRNVTQQLQDARNVDTWMAGTSPAMTVRCAKAVFDGFARP